MQQAITGASSIFEIEKIPFNVLKTGNAVDIEAIIADVSALSLSANRERPFGATWFRWAGIPQPSHCGRPLLAKVATSCSPLF
jgi:hypothetical protein